MISSANDEWFKTSLEKVARPDAPIGYGIVQPGPHVPGGIPVIAIRDLPKPSTRTVHRSSPHIESRYRRSRVAPGDILISVKGTTGRVGLVPDGFEGNISRDVARVRLREEQESRYWFQLLRSAEAQITLQLAAVGTTRQELSIGTLKKLSFRFPGRNEQERIAETLADADELIASIERIVTKKRAIKEGMTQQLLTGQTRLPGFAKPWSTTSLGAVGTFLKGRGIKRDDVRTTGIPCIRYGELYTAFNDYTTEALSFVAPEVAAIALPLQSGDLLFTSSGETREEIGKCVAYIGDVPAVAGGDLIVLRGTGFNPVYLGLLANTPDIANQKARAGHGDAVVHIRSSALARIQIDLPPSDEQDTIASVIRDTDLELRSLQQRLTKARAVKQGMMQELLTGRTRLPV